MFPNARQIPLGAIKVYLSIYLSRQNTVGCSQQPTGVYPLSPGELNHLIKESKGSRKQSFKNQPRRTLERDTFFNPGHKANLPLLRLQAPGELMCCCWRGMFHYWTLVRPPQWNIWLNYCSQVEQTCDSLTWMPKQVRPYCQSRESGWVKGATWKDSKQFP